MGLSHDAIQQPSRQHSRRRQAFVALLAMPNFIGGMHQQRRAGESKWK
jgi:hypothetical protein